MGWRDIPLVKQTEIPNVPHQDHVENSFRLSRRSAEVIRTRGKTVNAEFYKEVMDRLLKRIQRIRPAAFCCRDFFLLHDNVPAHKAANIYQFLTQKMLQPFLTPRNLQIYIRQTIFCSPS